MWDELSSWWASSGVLTYERICDGLTADLAAVGRALITGRATTGDQRAQFLAAVYQLYGVDGVQVVYDRLRSIGALEAGPADPNLVGSEDPADWQLYTTEGGNTLGSLPGDLADSVSGLWGGVVNTLSGIGSGMGSVVSNTARAIGGGSAILGSTLIVGAVAGAVALWYLSGKRGK